MTYFQIIKRGTEYLWNARLQTKFLRKFLFPTLNGLAKKMGYQFSAAEKEKIFFYYPLFNHIVNCGNYLIVKDRKLTLEESKRLSLVSAMAALYDDLIDEENYSLDGYNQIAKGILPPEGSTEKIEMIFALQKKLLKIWQPTENFNQCLNTAIQWQIASRNQLNKTISLEEVLLISKEKSGCSSLLWASLLDENWTVAEQAFIYHSGYVSQLINDLFDLQKDKALGLYSSALKLKSAQAIETVFLSACTELNQKILAVNCPPKLQQKTIEMYATIHAFGMISIQHLKKLNQKFPDEIVWEATERKDLVTDMALWKNKFLWFKYAKVLALLQ